MKLIPSENLDTYFIYRVSGSKDTHFPKIFIFNENKV